MSDKNNWKEAIGGAVAVIVLIICITIYNVLKLLIDGGMFK